MKKFGTRLISAVLAGCMMTSVLPVSAFALEGSAEFERTVSAQENSDAPAEPSGEVAAACPLTGGNIIDKKFIADHGGSKVYSMSGTYTDGIVIDAENEDATSPEKRPLIRLGIKKTVRTLLQSAEPRA